MFALAGISLLVSFVYIRPQEFVPFLDRIPLLYLFFALAAFGLAVDVRLRVTKIRWPPHTRWVVLFLIWAVATIAIYAPNVLIGKTVDLMIPIALAALLGFGIQTLRAYRIVAWLLVGLSFALALIAIHQANAPTGCVEVDTRNAGDLTTGNPDGRVCEKVDECYGFGANPSADYLCEKVGLFGTTSIGRRVRYRGILQDPNELALALAAGWGLSFGLLGARRRRRERLLVVVSGVATGLCVVYTQSRGGMLVLLTVVGVAVLWKYRWKGAAVGALLAMAMLVFMESRPERRDADQSSEERIEAWDTGIELFLTNPITGVGASQFTRHHYLTAHNSYLLVAAEMGIIGMFIWLTLLYLSLKTTFLISLRYRGDPDAAEAVRLSDALFGSIAGVAVGAFFLSLAYHMLVWIPFGLSAALYGTVRGHDPHFRIRFGLADAGIVFGLCIFILGFVRLFLRFKGI